tara:strand:+ start:1092 stop:1271 length:180 start_codon:yes stop_codon:yes gene_type:complete
MKEYFKFILDLIIKEKKEEQLEEDTRPSIQLEIQDEHITFPDKKQEDEEKKSSVIIIDI